MKDVIEFDDGTFINADCMDVMKDMQDKQFDLCLTDPPYTMDSKGGGLRKKRKIYAEMEKFMGENWFTPDFLSLILRKLKFPNLAIFGGRKDILNFLRFAESNDFLYAVLPLCKKNPMPFTNNTWLSNEYLFHLADRQITVSKNYKDKIPYFITGNEKETKHPNEKNINDILRILRNLTVEGDSVLDCFSGSGTTAISCHRGKRRFVCIEKDKEYFEMSVKRYEDEIKQMELF